MVAGWAHGHLPHPESVRPRFVLDLQILVQLHRTSSNGQAEERSKCVSLFRCSIKSASENITILPTSPVNGSRNSLVGSTMRCSKGMLLQTVPKMHITVAVVTNATVNGAISSHSSPARSCRQMMQYHDLHSKICTWLLRNWDVALLQRLSH